MLKREISLDIGLRGFLLEGENKGFQVLILNISP
jgi:hypothetical protein